MKKTFFASFLSLIIFFSFGSLVYATHQGTVHTAPTTKIEGEIENPFGSRADTLDELLETIINDVLLPIGGVLAVLAFIYSGFLFVMAQGSEDKIKTAKRALLYTAIGTAVLLGAWVISQVISNTVDQLKT